MDSLPDDETRMFQQFVLPAISFGLSAVSIPGPLQTYLLSVTLRYGWRQGLAVVVSPLVSDGPIILLMVFLLGALPAWVVQMIQFVGGLVLFWIAWAVWQQIQAGANFAPDDDALTPPEKEKEKESANHADMAPPLYTTLGKAVAINAFSPGPWLFWGTVTGPLLLQALNQSPLHGAAMLAGFYGTFLGGMILLALVFHAVGRINPRVTQAILRVALVLLIYFGASFIVQALTPLMTAA
jgi:threonine/homoserine/homoserine lactone efflux protein